MKKDTTLNLKGPSSNKEFSLEVVNLWNHSHTIQSHSDHLEKNTHSNTRNTLSMRVRDMFDQEHSQRNLFQQVSSDRILKQARRQLLKSMVGNERRDHCMKSKKRKIMFILQLMAIDLNFLRENSVGTTSMKLERNTLLDLKESELGLEKELKNTRQRWMNDGWL